MDTKLIKELIDLLENSTLEKLEVKSKDLEICLKKPSSEVVSVVKTANEVVSQVSEIKEIKQNTIDSPIVGTFYSKASPEASEYVFAGSRVKTGDVLCIIEAMKVMNEIKADKDGIIKEVLVKDGDLVEFDQPLFVIE